MPIAGKTGRNRRAGTLCRFDFFSKTNKNFVQQLVLEAEAAAFNNWTTWKHSEAVGGLSAMEGRHQERWQQLCKFVAEEKDRDRFSQLVQELLAELRKKEEWLKHSGGESRA